MRQLQVRYVNYYRQRKYARDLIFGQYSTRFLRHEDYKHDEVLGLKIETCHKAFYQLPALPRSFNVFSVAIEIADKVYAISHQGSGNITQIMADEGCNAALAYLGEYLPNQLLRKEDAF